MERMIKKNKIKDNKIIQGVIGFIISIIGLLFAFQTKAENYFLFITFIIMIIIGIVLVAKALSD